MKRLYSICAVVAMFSCLAHADVIYDNTGTVSGGADPIAFPSQGFFGPLYGSFSTGPGGGVLADLTLLLKGTADLGSIDIGLYSDSSTVPDSEILDFGTLLDSSLTDAAALYDIQTGDPNLAPDTRYWIGLYDNSSASFTSAFWDYSTDTSGVGVEDEYFANSNGVFANDPNGPYQMSVTLTPEPATWTLLPLGLCTWIFGRFFTRRIRSARPV